MNKEEFRKRFERLVNIMWTIQRRIGELEEFERQWLGVFNLLREKSGGDCKVRILNWDVYHSFRWDKYHVLISDLLSALENEFDNEHSVCRQALHHLKIASPDEYVDRNQKVNFIYEPGFPISKEEEERREREIQNQNGQRLRMHSIEAMASLFPNIGEAEQPSSSDIRDLTSRLRALSDQIYSARQVFAHKHQELIVRKHNVGLDRANVEQIKSIASQFFDVIKHIGLVSHQSSYADLSANQKRLIEDQIDLILFGSISSIHLRFYESAKPGERYRDVRARYYESKELLTIVADKDE